MAVTGGGTPYVESSDLVASYPATSLALANKVDTKLDNAPTDNAQSGTTYTFVLADARQLVTATSASAKTFTIPPQSSVTWLTGSMIRVVNYGAGALTVDGGVGVTVTNTAATIGQYAAATAIRTGSNAWTLVPFAGGVGNADFSNAATGTYTDGGFNWKYITFNSTDTLTFTKSGIATVLVVAGGGGGNDPGAFSSGSGGGGGYVEEQIYIPSAATWQVTVGAGGASGAIGADSLFVSATSGLAAGFIARGGGNGGSVSTQGRTGGSSGGGGFDAGSTASALYNGAQGFNGSGIAANTGRGGGAGGAAVTTTPGPGKASTITGTSVTRAAGGGGSGNGAANSGNGGGSGVTSGGSGVVIIAVKV